MEASKSQPAIVKVVEVADLGVLIYAQRHAWLVHSECVHTALDLLDIPLVLAQKRSRRAKFRRLEETLIWADEMRLRRRRTLAFERAQVHDLHRAHVVAIVVWLKDLDGLAIAQKGCKFGNTV